MATNISTIGNTGRDYTTFLSWESATDNDLVAAGDIEIGELYDDANFTSAGTLFGAITDASNYRACYAAAGEEFDVDAGTGVEFVKTNHSSNSEFMGINEKYGRLGEGDGNLGAMGFDITNIQISGTGFTLGAGNSTTNEGNIFSHLFVKSRNSGTYDVNTLCAVLNQTGNASVKPIVKNCVFKSEEGTQDGIDFLIQVASNWEIMNCSAIGSSGTTNCYIVVATKAGLFMVNNIGGTSTGSAFSITPTGTPAAEDYNCSDDTSAVGANSLINQTMANIYTDTANDDFTLKAGSNAIGAGDDLSAIFTVDFDGTTRATWDMGAFYSPAAAATGITQYLMMIT